MQPCAVSHPAACASQTAQECIRSAPRAQSAAFQRPAQQRRRQRAVAAEASAKAGGPGKHYIDAVEKEVAAFAPATVANLGPGFDWMGCAVEVGRRRRWLWQAGDVAAAAPCRRYLALMVWHPDFSCLMIDSPCHADFTGRWRRCDRPGAARPARRGGDRGHRGRRRPPVSRGVDTCAFLPLRETLAHSVCGSMSQQVVRGVMLRH